MAPDVQPGSSTVPCGHLGSAPVCLRPAEVTPATANRSTNEWWSRQDGAAQGACSASQCQPMLGTGQRSSRGWHQAAPGIPAAAAQLAWETRDWDTGEKGASQEQESPVLSRNTLPMALSSPFICLQADGCCWWDFPFPVTRHIGLLQSCCKRFML